LTKTEAQQYLWQTDWHELVRIATGQPMPPDIEEKREEAYRVLKESE